MLTSLLSLRQTVAVAGRYTFQSVNCSGKSGPKDQVALHTTTILRLRIGARLTRYRNRKFHNGCRHADGISRYSVPPSADPLLPLVNCNIIGGVQSLQSAVMKLASWTLCVTDIVWIIPELHLSEDARPHSCAS